MWDSQSGILYSSDGFACIPLNSSQPGHEHILWTVVSLIPDISVVSDRLKFQESLEGGIFLYVEVVQKIKI